MGHYCDICDEKIHGGIIPTTCECIESICRPCWKSFFKIKYIKYDEPVYINNNDKFVPINKELYYKHEIISDEKCKHCDTKFEKNKYNKYNDDSESEQSI